MKKNSSINNLKEIAGSLIDSKIVLIFPHIQLDGDAMGSSAALCHTLRKQGKNAHVIIEDKLPDNLKFLDNGYCIMSYEGGTPDLCIALDCSDISRIGKRKECFFNGKKTALIDHHVTFQPFSDINYLNIDSSSTGEIVYMLLKEMGIQLDMESAEAIYTAIVTDTGRFMYANTTKDTHRIVSDLYESGMDHNKVATEIYQRKRIEKIKLFYMIMGDIELYFNNRCCLALLTKQMLLETKAFPEESEGIVEELRSIEGVEIAILLKEEEDAIKVTLRSKSLADVSLIAAGFGGGGHRKAAGCTINGSIAEVKKQVLNAVAIELERLEG